MLSAATIALAGVVVGLLGFRAFKRAGTTIDPVRPDAASTLVTGGIYRHTRKPVYVGFTLTLLGFAVLLGSPWALVGPAAFVLFTARFQIAPEERALLTKFGRDFAKYKKSTRRWL